MANSTTGVGEKLYPETLKHIPLLLLIKQKSGQDLAVFFAKLTCLHGDSGRRKRVKTKTHISTTATTKYSEKSNITLMNIILGSGLSQTCILYDT